MPTPQTSWPYRGVVDLANGVRVEGLLAAVAAATFAVATPITDALRQEEAPVNWPHPLLCPRGGLVLTGAPATTLTACLRLRPTPLLSMQVALLRGQSQLGPVQPGSHTHWPMEQRPRSAEGSGEGKGEPIHTGSPGCPPASKGLWEVSLGSWDVSSPGQNHLCLDFLEFPSFHLSPSFSPSTFLSAARVTTPKHKFNYVAPLFKNH